MLFPSTRINRVTGISLFDSATHNLLTKAIMERIMRPLFGTEVARGVITFSAVMSNRSWHYIIVYISQLNS